MVLDEMFCCSIMHSTLVIYYPCLSAMARGTKIRGGSSYVVTKWKTRKKGVVQHLEINALVMMLSPSSQLFREKFTVFGLDKHLGSFEWWFSEECFCKFNKHVVVENGKLFRNVLIGSTF